MQVETWQRLVAQRQAAGLTQMQVAASIGVKQPITISHWERGINRPILPHFKDYLRAIGWNDAVEYDLVPSKIDERLAQDDASKNARWREISSYKLFRDFTPLELAQLGPQVQIVPQAHGDRALTRYLPVSRELMWFLGWYIAEGTLSAHQVSLNLGKKDERFIAELSAVIKEVFGETARRYQAPENDGLKLYFHSVAVAQLLRAWGLDGRAHEKKLPDIVFSLSEELQLTLLEGYFLGDGTTTGNNLSFTTNSPDLKDGLLYLLGQLGIVATTSHLQPSTGPDAPIQTRHSYYNITICGKEQIEQCRAIWQRHVNASKLDAYLARPIRKSLDYIPISEDLIGLEVIAAEKVEPKGEYVYDFSIQDDENFVCGIGGLCAHNTDADVDGSHIRTLLLTFFFRYMEPLIEDGHLFIAQPPLYRVESKKKHYYVYSEAEKDKLVAKLDGGNVAIQRYKGLGEMNPEQLWETTMNPEARTILQVSIEDAAAADRTFDMLMGSSVPPRKRFIQTHAKSVRNLDV
jgi:DNA gyrase subunit B